LKRNHKNSDALQTHIWSFALEDLPGLVLCGLWTQIHFSEYTTDLQISSENLVKEIEHIVGHL
jgi:hypothetical protein